MRSHNCCSKLLSELKPSKLFWLRFLIVLAAVLDKKAWILFWSNLFYLRFVWFFFSTFWIPLTSKAVEEKWQIYFLQIKVYLLLHYVPLLPCLWEALQNVLYNFWCLLVEGISSLIFFSKTCNWRSLVADKVEAKQEKLHSAKEDLFSLSLISCDLSFPVL